MERKDSVVLVFLAVLVFEGYFCGRGYADTVTYDHRALVVNGQRRVLLSGSIHYPRSTEDVWPELIRKSKEGGLDVIETYVFWNYHEPVKGQYYFEGRFDLVKFVKTVQEAGLFVHLRIGPYACAEWNYGGFPLWLHFIPGIQFRTTNTPFKNEMKRFLAKIVSIMQEEKLFASQGGPIILAQVENEYGNVEWAYGVGGELYVQWAAEAAIGLNTSVPWVMCQQEDAPDPIINTCNGFYCDQFTPNSPSKPKMWTESYSGWFLAFGNAIPFRPVEDLAFSVARFFEMGGTLQNYYMYFGGTNFGRTAGGPLIATSYDYDAPIDEYGFIRQPKWGHLRDLHMAIKQCETYLVNSDPSYMPLGPNLEELDSKCYSYINVAGECETRIIDQMGHVTCVPRPKNQAHVYYKKPDGCAAFLANIDQNVDANVSFHGNFYSLPAWSVSILPDCKNVIFNTAKVVSQQSLGDFSNRQTSSVKETILATSKWGWYKEQVGIWSNNSFTSSGLLEQINTTRDVSDYLWYTASIDVTENEKEVYLNVASLGHAAMVFVNKRFVGFGYGNHDDASFTVTQKIMLNQGKNTLDMLSMIIGIQNYGPWFDIAGAGIFSVALVDLMNAKEDLSFKAWSYQVGMEGEYLGLDQTSLANSLLWTTGIYPPVNQTLIWYKTTFIAPEGNGPLSLNLASMGKGQAWINGEGIGRYWPAYLAPTTGCSEPCDYRGSYDASKCLKNCGQPAQILYHIPRSWVHPGENLLVLHEELGGDPSKITVSTRTGQEICALISESDPLPVNSWKLNSEFKHKSPEVRLDCERGWKITSINFASFGTPKGQCGEFSHGSCSAENVLPVFQKACIGHESCTMAVSTLNFGDPCVGVLKSLAVEALCSA